MGGFWGLMWDGSVLAILCVYSFMECLAFLDECYAMHLVFLFSVHAQSGRAAPEGV